MESATKKQIEYLWCVAHKRIKKCKTKNDFTKDVHLTKKQINYIIAVCNGQIKDKNNYVRKWLNKNLSVD